MSGFLLSRPYQSIDRSPAPLSQTERRGLYAGKRIGSPVRMPASLAALLSML